jgi:gluconolactonase
MNNFAEARLDQKDHNRMGRAAAAVVIATLFMFVGCTKEPEKPVTESAKPQVHSDLVRLDPAFDSLVPPSAQLEKLADGFQFVEGPLWFDAGHVWFSDVQGNVIRQWSQDGKITEILRPGGYDGKDIPEGSLMGPNGMVHDKDGAVLVCQHGNRQIARISKDRKVSSLVSKYKGKRLNSPNDLVFKSDGSLYFTDPPYGLPKQDDDPKKELKFNGVYRLARGNLQPIIQDLSRPNGIAFSPDEKILYISVSDEKHKVWMRYDVNPDGSVKDGRVFSDATSETTPGLPDGMKVDSKGNLYCAGPGGVWVFSAEGKHLGTIKTPNPPSNCNWGDDGKTLYITAVDALYRIKLSTPGEQAMYR